MSKVSIIVPCRNEVNFIEPFLESLLKQDQQDMIAEILIADGMSNDGTREKIENASLSESRIKLVKNEERIVSTGLNRAIEQSTSEIIIRMDVHTTYNSDYIAKCISILEKTGAANVGGPWRAKGVTYIEKAIAAAFQSPFSSGGALSHYTEYEGEVDSVYLGCWRRKTLLSLNGFDDNLVRNQDDELNYRLTKAGHTIWQSKEIKSKYRPRGSFRALFKQYFQYGYWKTFVMKKHRIPAKLRHIIPPFALLLSISLLITGLFIPVAYYILLFMTTVYFILNLGFSLSTCLKSKNICLLPAVLIAFPVFHISYALGLLSGILAFVKTSNSLVNDISR